MKDWWQNAVEWIKSRSKKFWIIVVAVVVVIAVGIAAWEWHEQPSMCKICHLMDSYYEDYQSSDFLANAHAEADVTCLDCHGFSVVNSMREAWTYMTNKFEDPLWERVFANEMCLESGCHDMDDVNAIYPHADESTITCGDCHNVHRESTLEAPTPPAANHAHLTDASMCAVCHQEGGLAPWISSHDSYGKTSCLDSGCHVLP
jgi:nitrate/TMAO reductase-like tetraheme cytochrome c subunit